MEKEYLTDFRDKHWQKVRQLLPSRAKSGRKPLDRRSVLNAILYVNRTGCHWRCLPKSVTIHVIDCLASFNRLAIVHLANLIIALKTN